MTSEWVIIFNRNGFANQLLNIPQISPFLVVAKGKSYTAGTCPSGSANTMHIGFGNIWQFIIDHMGQFVNINTPGCNIRSYEHPGLGRFKIPQRSLASILRFVAMDGFSCDASFYKILYDLV
jgi:hypothetical protein